MQGTDGIGRPDRGLEATTRIGSSGAYQGGLRLRGGGGAAEVGPGGGLRPSDGRRSSGGTAMGPARKEGGERTGGPSFFRHAGPYCLWADISFAGFILYRTGPC
jgi:hypothetical protein